MIRKKIKIHLKQIYLFHFSFIIKNQHFPTGFFNIFKSKY